MSQTLLALLLLASPDTAVVDCGAASHKAEIAQTMLSVRRTVPVEATVGEFPTKEGTHECVRVTFSLTPWGTMYRLRFVETSGNAAFELAARRAIDRYEFEGSVPGIFETKTLVLDGIDNKKPAD